MRDVSRRDRTEIPLQHNSRNPRRIPSCVGSISSTTVRVYTVPTDAPEANGTLSWDSTTMVLVELAVGASSIHMHPCCAVPRARHLEFFHDHARMERMFFEGFCEPRQGHMLPDWSRAGLGLELKEKDAEKFLG